MGTVERMDSGFEQRLIGALPRPRRNQCRSRRTFATLGAVFLSVLITFSLPSTAVATTTGDAILVFAAASLADALTEAGEIFEQETGTEVTLHFAASSMLARQVRMGAPADVFLSADEAKMDDIQGADLLVSGTRRSLFGNQLVVVVANDSDLELSSLADLAIPSVGRIVLADPRSVPAGIYARQVIEAEGLWAELAPRLIPMSHVRAALAAVESGNADAGFVYLTDARSSDRVSIAFRVPIEPRPSISYPIAAIRRSQPNPAAVRFTVFLAEPEVGRIFASHGFRLLDAPEITSVDAVNTAP